MLAAIDQIERYTAGMTLDTFCADQNLRSLMEELGR